MTFAKYARYFLYVLMGVSVLLIGLFYFGGVVEGTEDLTHPEPKITDAIIKFSYVLLALSAGLAIAFLVIQLVSNLSLLKRSAIVIVIIAVIFLISRSMASDQLLDIKGYADNNPKTLKDVGTGLISTYILLGTTIVAMIYSEISKIFK
jgi:uncharacterized membrane protein